MKTTALHTGLPSPPYLISACPSNVMLDVTYRCNQRCIFCYNSPEIEGIAHPSLQSLSETLSTIAKWGVKEVLYLGGEPSLYPWLCEVLKLGHSLGLVQRLVSNGSGFSPSLVMAVAMTGTEVGVTFHSPDANIHDFLADSPGSHARAVKAVNCLLDANVSTYVQFTLTRGRLGALRELASWLLDRFRGAISLIDMTRLVPQGRGHDVKTTQFPQEEELWDALVRIPEINAEGFTVRTEALPHCWVMGQARTRKISMVLGAKICRAIRPCLMGIDQIAFAPDGRMKICPCVEPFSPPIVDSATPMPGGTNVTIATELWKQHPVLLQRRLFDFLPRVCIDPLKGWLCPLFYSCGGGCRSSGGTSECCVPDGLISPFGLDEVSALALDVASL